MSQHIAFLGLGAMGAPIARHLAAKGAETVTACDADPARLAGLDGPRLVATTDRSRIAGADVLFLCLPDGAVVEATLFGPDGVAERLAPGAIVVDLSTTTHADALRIGRALAAGGGASSTHRSQARRPGRGGDADRDVRRRAGGLRSLRPLLERFGTTVLHMGPAGAGQLTKTVNNVLYDINIAALAEVLPMAVAMGLDPAQLGKSSRRARAAATPRNTSCRASSRVSSTRATPSPRPTRTSSAPRRWPPSTASPPRHGGGDRHLPDALRQGHGDRDKGAMVLPFETCWG